MSWPDYKRNMRGDPFSHIISRCAPDGTVLEHLAGANNIFVASRAFEQILFYYQENDMLTLREGAHVLRREQGTGEWHKAFVKRTLGINR